MSEGPKIIVAAGCNGAGKSTIAPHLLRDALDLKAFVNADTIAQGLSAFSPEAEGNSQREEIFDLEVWEKICKQAE